MVWPPSCAIDVEAIEDSCCDGSILPSAIYVDVLWPSVRSRAPPCATSRVTPTEEHTLFEGRWNCILGFETILAPFRRCPVPAGLWFNSNYWKKSQSSVMHHGPYWFEDVDPCLIMWVINSARTRKTSLNQVAIRLYLRTTRSGVNWR